MSAPLIFKGAALEGGIDPLLDRLRSVPCFVFSERLNIFRLRTVGRLVLLVSFRQLLMGIPRQGFERLLPSKDSSLTALLPKTYAPSAQGNKQTGRKDSFKRL